MVSKSDDFGKTVIILLILIAVLVSAKIASRVMNCASGVQDPECKSWVADKE